MNKSGRIRTSDAADTAPLAAMALAALAGQDNQRCCDALLMAMVTLIQAGIPKEYQADVARGVAGALISNFEALAPNSRPESRGTV